MNFNNYSFIYIDVNMVLGCLHEKRVLQEFRSTSTYFSEKFSDMFIDIDKSY